MPDKKADTTISEIISLAMKSMITSETPHEQFLVNLPKLKNKTSKRKMKTENNLNKTFRLRRNGYIVIANIITMDSDGGKGFRQYSAKITAIEEGKCPFNIGDTLPVTDWELSVSGKEIV